MELLGVIAFITLILGPIGFFLSLGVRPRLLELERARDDAIKQLSPRIADIEQRLRRIEEYLAEASRPVPRVPAREPRKATSVPLVDTATVSQPAASAAAAPPDTVTGPTVEPAEAPAAAPPIVPEETTATSPPAAAAPPVAPAEPVETPTATEPTPPEQIAPSTAPAQDAEQTPPETQAAEPVSPERQPADPNAAADKLDIDRILAAAAAEQPLPQPEDEKDTPARPQGLRGLEEAIGTRWTVWVGGLALALGAILLVRLSIERGFFGPGVRIALGFLLAAVLVGAGEFLRRRDREPTGDSRAAYIPGMLTATGTIAAFGTVYAAYALYQFIGPAVAFLALGAIGLACMGAASLHGPALAGLGLVGSLATPLLIQSTDPSPWTLVWYVGIVSTAAHALARLRNWLWLSLVAAAAAGAWALLMLLGPVAPSFYRAAIAHIVLQTALAAFFLSVVRSFAVADDTRPYRPAEIVLAAAGLLTVVALFRGTIAGHFGTTWLLGAASITAILALTALRAASVASAIAAAGLVVLAALLLWPPLVAIGDGRLDRIILLLPPPHDPVRYVVLGAIGCLGLAALAAARLLRAGNLPLAPATFYAGAAALTPLGGLAIGYLRIAQGDASLALAGAALVLAATFGAGTVLFLKRRARRPSDATRIALGAFASAAIAAAAFALVFALDGGMLTVAFALAAVGTAFVAVRLDLTALRWCVAALGILVGARLAWDPRIVGSALSTTPIFNWLLFGYGIPALSFVAAGWIMRTRRDDTPVRVADALGILFAAFLVFFEIRHAMNGGEPFAPGSGLLEQGLLAVASFGFGIVLTRLDASRANIVFRIASLAAGAAGMALAVIGLGLRWNPLFVPEAVEGGRFLNALLLGYLLPGLLAGLLAIMARDTRPAWYYGGAGAIALACCIGYLVLQTRLLFHGQTISIDRGATLAELGLDTTWCLVVAAALAATSGVTASPLRRAALLALGLLAAAIGVLGLGVLHNPLLHHEIIAGTIFNALIVGYLLPALAAVLLAVAAGRTAYRPAAAAASFLLALTYLLLEVRLLFRGPVIVLERGASLAELGIQSTVCLVIAAGILAMLAHRATPLLNGVFAAVLMLAATLFVGGPALRYNPLFHLEPVAGNAIFNALIPGYLLPALAMVLMALVVRRLWPAQARVPAVLAAALALAYLLLEVRVLFHGMTIPLIDGAGIAELGIDTAIFLVCSIALIHAARQRQSELLLRGAMVLGLIALALAVLGPGIFANPLRTGAPVAGNALINTLLVGYGLIAALAFVLALEASRRTPPRPAAAFRVTASIASIAALFVYVTLETRRVFQGEIIFFARPTGETEWYAYSAVWLVLGIVLLAYGMWRRSITVRLASAVFVFASVGKVFVFDLAWLEGFLRAASVLGLGFVLMGIGLAYQKLVFARRGAGAEPSPRGA